MKMHSRRQCHSFDVTKGTEALETRIVTGNVRLAYV